MEFVRKFAKPLTPVLTFAMVVLSCYIPAANAKVVSTQTIVDNATVSQERQRIRAYYDRKDVQSALKKYGVSAKEAKARINSMSDKEVHLVAQRIDKMPAGAGAAEAVLIVFLVLIILELMGVTNIFSFI